MESPWSPTDSGDSATGSGPTLADRPGLGGVSETQRRNAIVSLVDQRPQTPFTIGELTDSVSEWFEHETAGMVPTDEEIHSVLYDFDLPRLDAADQLVFDQERGLVHSTQVASSTAAKAPRESTERGTAHLTSATARASDSGATAQFIPDGNVSAGRVVELGVLLLGVAGVALTASSLSPFDTSYALVPVALVVLFFGYRALSRR